MVLSPNRVFIHGALIGTVCDVPASMKVDGYVGHSAKLGSAECIKPFVTKPFDNKADYGGFDVSQWPIRTNDDQRHFAYKHLIAQTAAARNKIEQEYGAKYSVLFELPYYDTVHCLIIDLIHAGFLGVAKHTTQLWYNLNIVTPSQSQVMQERVNKLITPSSLQNLPITELFLEKSDKIHKTADQ